MSYTIEYQHACFAVPSGQYGIVEPRFVVACECGSSNCYDHRNRRTRDWTVLFVGTHSAVLKQAVRSAADCEGGMLKSHKGRYSPEAYIARIRRLIDSPPSAVGAWTPRLRVPETSPLAAELLKTFDVNAQLRSGSVEACFAQSRLGEYFALIERFPLEAGWHLATVAGLPCS